MIILSLFCFSILNGVVSQVFEHPGIFNRECDFARMRQKIAEKAEPWYSTWNNLLASPEAQVGWAGPRAVATIIRGGTGDNVSLLYRDVAAAYQNALIYKISGDKAHGDKAVAILNAWASINTAVSGNADRYLAAGLDGYQFANAAEMMRGYPGFDIEKFKNYMLNVFFYPMNERFLIGNAWGAPHNDACSTNYRVNWDACNMNAMLAISILCDNKTGFDEAINYCKSGDGTGQIARAVPFLHPDYPTTGANIIGQWEESGRDQGHAVGGMSLYGLFCEIAWNQGVDIYSYDNSRFRKGAEYVARYNLGDSVAGQWKYENLPYTSYSRMMGSNCTWYTEPVLGGATRGKLGASWELIYNHYARRLNQGDKVTGLQQILNQQQWWSRSWPTLNIHADTYDTPGGGGLTFCTDSGSCILPWLNMDIMPRSIEKLANYGRTTYKDSVLTVNGAGSGVAGTLDHCQYAYQRLIDDGSIVTRLDSATEPNTYCQAGLMLREGLEQNSANAFLSLTAAKGLVFSTRDSTSKATSVVASDNSIKAFPYWLKLSKTGNVITVSSSADGLTWVDLTTRTMKLNRSVYLGVAVSSYNQAQVCKAVFTKTKFIQGNIKPIVKFTAPTANISSLIAPANITLKGLAYDPDGQLGKAEVYVNGALSYTSTASPFSYSMSKLTEGSYKIHIKAYDKLGATQTTDTLTLTVNTKTSKLPYYHFEETTSGYFTKDGSGNNLTGILYNGPTFSTGKVGNGIVLDGTDDHVKLPGGFVDKLSDFTVASWVYANSQTAWARIFDFGSGTGSYMYLCPYNGSGLTEFKILNSTGTTQTVTAAAVATGAWHHVAVTIGSDKATIYIDGNVAGAAYPFYLRPYDIASSTTNYLGKSQYASDPYFNGKLNEMHFFNYALSQTEVKNEMLNTATDKVFVNPQMFYPNPAKGEIHVVNTKHSQLQIYDTMGKNILQQTINSSNEAVDISRLSSGIYLVLTTDENQQLQQNRLIVR
ncbi:MAG: alginate lyase family protein [Paludibacter sp.]